MWSTGKGNGNPHQYSCHKNPMNNMYRQKDIALEDEPLRLVHVQMLRGKSRGQLLIAPEKNERAGPNRR